MAAVGLDAPQLALDWRLDAAGHTLQQHRRITEHRVQRRPELVRHVREELRLQGRRLFELDGLAPQQLVLLRDVGCRRLNLAFELVRGLLQLLVQPRLFDRLAAVVEDRHHGRQLTVLGQHLSRDGLDRHRLAGFGIAQSDLADAPPIRADEHVGDERREVRVVGLHPALLDRARLRRDREEALGGLIHQRRRTDRVGHDNGVRDRVDDEVQPIALGAPLDLGDAHLAIMDLIEFPAENGREPVELLRERRRAADEQQTNRVVRKSRDAERDDVKDAVLERRGGASPAIVGRMGARREKERFSIRERGDQRVAPFFERHGVARDRRPRHSGGTDHDQAWLGLGPDKADRLRDAQDFAKPLQCELRAVRNLGPADEALQQPDSRRQHLAVPGGAFVGRHTDLWSDRVGRRPVSLAHAPARPGGGRLGDGP